MRDRKPDHARIGWHEANAAFDARGAGTVAASDSAQPAAARNPVSGARCQPPSIASGPALVNDAPAATGCVAVVPVKPVHLAKARLSGVLGEGARASLANAMLNDVLDALARSSAVAATVLVAPDGCVPEAAVARSLRVLPEQGGAGLDGAVRYAAMTLAGEGAHTIAAIPADLPLLDAGDVDALLRVHGASPACTVAAADDGGTNALVLSPPTLVTPRYGERSAERHLARALAAGIEARVHSSAAFRFDVDSAADLVRLFEMPLRGATRAWLSAQPKRLRSLGNTSRA